MRLKQRLIQAGFRLHHAVIWAALVALVLFAVSGFMHVLLTWTGPQSMVQRPPQQLFTRQDLQAVAPLLQQHGIDSAQIVKLVPSSDGALLQISQHANAPRRYFDPQSMQELADHDEQQALWLARYYLGGTSRSIEKVEFVTSFNSEYSWVNRLLPVYRVQFSGDDSLTLFVHTETLALAGIADNWKRQVQGLFQQLHTFSWLDDARHMRVILMALLLLCLVGMVSSGMVLLYVLRRKGRATPVQRGHRLLAHLVAIPLFGFAVSGF